MNRKRVRSPGVCDGTHVCIPIPVGDRDAFTHDATADILQLLTDNPEKTFSNRELHRLTPSSSGLGPEAIHHKENVPYQVVQQRKFEVQGFRNITHGSASCFGDPLT